MFACIQLRLNVISFAGIWAKTELFVKMKPSTWWWHTSKEIQFFLGGAWMHVADFMATHPKLSWYFSLNQKCQPAGWQIYHLGTMDICTNVQDNPSNIFLGTFYKKQKSGWHRWKWQGIPKVRLHPLGTMNGCTTFHDIPSNIYWDTVFLSGPKWWTNWPTDRLTDWNFPPSSHTTTVTKKGQNLRGGN